MSDIPLSSYAFTEYGGDAKLYNGVHDLEAQLIDTMSTRDAFSLQTAELKKELAERDQRITELASVIERLARIACGEDQVAADDFEGMKVIYEEARAALGEKP